MILSCGRTELAIVLPFFDGVFTWTCDGYCAAAGDALLSFSFFLDDCGLDDYCVSIYSWTWTC